MVVKEGAFSTKSGSINAFIAGKDALPIWASPRTSCADCTTADRVRVCNCGLCKLSALIGVHYSAAETAFTLIEYDVLPRRHRPLRRVKYDFQSAGRILADVARLIWLPIS